MAYDRDLWIDTVLRHFDTSRTPACRCEVRWNTALTALDADTAGGWWLDPKGSDFGPNAKYYEYSIEEAKKLMSAAGYADGLELVDSFVAGTEYGASFHEWLEITQGMEKEIGITSLQQPRRSMARSSGRKTETPAASSRASPPSSDRRRRPPTRWVASPSTTTRRAVLASTASMLPARATAKVTPTSTPSSPRPTANSMTTSARPSCSTCSATSRKKQYAAARPGGKTNFDVVWPVVGNYRVWNGGSANSYRIRYSHWWFDGSKPGA